MKANNYLGIKKGIKVFDIINAAILGILVLVCIFPFYNVVLVSFASYKAITGQNIYLIPTSFDISAYKFVLEEKDFYNAAIVSAFVTLAGVVISMFLSVTGAYALSKRELPGRQFILGAILFTMFFHGGLIPFYLTVKSVGLVNSIFAMVVPPAISTMYLIIMKNYFRTLPAGIEESAKIDGANDIYILARIVIPVSAPFMATFALFYAVERWNEWWYALIFINKSMLQPLQIYLREVLVNMNLGSTMGAAIRDSEKETYMPGVQMAVIVVSALPIICIYPFLQKHFVKGILIGSIKG